jgi:Ca-activated chloride channel family protein
MTRAVELAAEELKHREKPAIVVLLTDGEETCGGDPCATAARLKAEGLNLVVHVIGYQMREAAGTLGTVQSRCMAQATGGQYAHADSVEDIKRALSSMLGCPDVSRAPDHAAR